MTAATALGEGLDGYDLGVISVVLLLAVVLAYVLTGAGLSWQWILATSAMPALLTLVLRYGLRSLHAGR